MSVFLACGPTEGGNNGSGDAGDNGGDAGNGGGNGEATTYTLNVTVTNPDKGGVTVDPPTGPYVENSTVTITVSPEEGCRLKEWSGDASGNYSPLEVLMTDNKTITATFENIPTYAITVAIPEGEGTYTLDPAEPQGGYPEETEVTLTVVPATGHYFVQWEETGDMIHSSIFRNPLKLVMSKDFSFTAKMDESTELLEDDFEYDAFPSEYKITTTESSDHSWELVENEAGGKLAYVEATDTEYNNNTRLELKSLDLTSVGRAYMKFEYNMSHYWAIQTGEAGDHHEGGYDLRVEVSTDCGATWTEEWHEADDPAFDSVNDNFETMPYILNLGEYAGQSDVKVGFHVIGVDCAEVSIDNIAIRGTSE